MSAPPRASPSPRWWPSSASAGSLPWPPSSTGRRCRFSFAAEPSMPDHLRVGLVVGPTTGGIGRHVRALAGELVARGHAVTVVGPASTADLFDWTGLGAVFAPAPIGATAPVQVARAVRAVRAAADAVDVVHAHGARAGAVTALAGIHPLVVTWHNTRPARLRRRLGHPLAERLAARAADLTLAVSPDLLERAARAGAAEI